MVGHAQAHAQRCCRHRTRLRRTRHERPGLRRSWRRPGRRRRALPQHANHVNHQVGVYRVVAIEGALEQRDGSLDRELSVFDNFLESRKRPGTNEHARHVAMLANIIPEGLALRRAERCGCTCDCRGEDNRREYALHPRPMSPQPPDTSRPYNAFLGGGGIIGACYNHVIPPARPSVIYFFVLGEKRRRCETRLGADGNGYELVITDDSGEHVEHFKSLPNVLSREHELVTAWRAQGWRDTTSRHRAESGRSRRPATTR
jgi:hypothetical protein